MKNIWTWLLLGMLVPSVGLNVKDWCSGETAPPPACAHCGSGSKFDIDALDLTSEQAALLKQSCEECAVVQGNVSTDEQNKIDALLAALRSDKVDKAKIHKLADELGELRKRQVHKSVGALLKVREVLTPEQLNRLSACCGSDK